MANKHIKRHSKLLVIKKLQMKMVKRYHLLPIRMTIIKNKYKKEQGGGEIMKSQASGESQSGENIK